MQKTLHISLLRRIFNDQALSAKTRTVPYASLSF